MLHRAGSYSSLVARRSSRSRPGFTLVELLIVIAIIAVLAALTTAGVSRVRDMGRRAQAVNDISQLSEASLAFKNKYGFFPPSTFTVPTQVNRADVNYMLLVKMFRAWPPNRDSWPDMTSLTAAAPAGPGVQPITFRGVDISGKTLDGNQCMLFFLGGPNQQGFDPSGPYPSNTTGKTKVGPWYDFQEARLQIASNQTNGLPWFPDPWGTPYAFFSCGSGDSYATNVEFPLRQPAGPAVPASPGPGPDTWTTAKGVSSWVVTPYRSGNRWINPGGVQIISAGPNGAARRGPIGFGPGSVTFAAAPAAPFVDWTPGTGNYGPETAGEDDLANFNNGAQLGSSGQ